MICQGCGNKDAYHLQTRFSKEGRTDSCNACGDLHFYQPDVYFKGAYWDEHLASEAHPGPKFITSRAEKKKWLEKCNLREAGDRHHGASSFDPISNRHAMDSLRRTHNGKR